MKKVILFLAEGYKAKLTPAQEQEQARLPQATACGSLV